MTIEHEAIAYCRQFVNWLDNLAATGHPIPDGIGDTWHGAADMLKEMNPVPARRLWVASATGDAPEEQAVADEAMWILRAGGR